MCFLATSIPYGKHFAHVRALFPVARVGHFTCSCTEKVTVSLGAAATGADSRLFGSCAARFLAWLEPANPVALSQSRLASFAVRRSAAQSPPVGSHPSSTRYGNCDATPRFFIRACFHAPYKIDVMRRCRTYFNGARLSINRTSTTAAGTMRFFHSFERAFHFY